MEFHLLNVNILASSFCIGQTFLYLHGFEKVVSGHSISSYTCYDHATLSQRTRILITILCLPISTGFLYYVIFPGWINQK